jgi:hypothetical protein
MAAKKRETKKVARGRNTTVVIEGDALKMLDDLCDSFESKNGIRPSRSAMFRLAIRKFYESQ